ncbi:MAG: DUF87 domain-containing protein [Desulfurococcales archaeon]|nr:DUF87 domain-containing protein [Desulfurococcales archaeon]
MLEDAPRIVRILPGIAGILLALYSLDLIQAPSIPLLPLGIAGLAGMALIASRGLWRRPAQGVEEDGVEFKVFELEPYKAQAEAGRLAELIRERASSSGVRYTIISSMEGGYGRNLIVLSAPSRDKVLVEGEVFKTLVSSIVDGVRVREASDPEVLGIVTPISRIMLKTRPLQIPSIQGASPGPVAAGEIYLGELIDSSTPRRVFISLADIRGHVGVFGSTGSGKSTTLALLAKRVSGRGLRVVVLDWTGEYESLLSRLGASFKVLDPAAGEAPANPLSLARGGDIDMVLEILSKSLNLTQPQEYLLQKVLEKWGPSNPRDLLDYVEGYPEESKWDREVKRGLARRLGILARGQGSIAFSGEPFRVPGHRLTIVRCDRLRNTSLRTVYILTVLASLFSNPPSHGVLLVIDEAHNIFSREWGGFPDQLVSESRKYGIHLAIATQAPSEVSNSILLNTNTKIIHALKSARDKQIVSTTLSLGEEGFDRLDKLAPGEALVDAPSLRTPVFVRIDAGEPG